MKDSVVVGEFEYVLRWYNPQGETLVGEEAIPSLTPDVVRRWFGVGDDESPIECYAVRARHVDELDEYVVHRIDLAEYEYFLEANSV